MFAKLFIILFLILPQSIGFAAIPKIGSQSDQKSKEIRDHLEQKPNDSSALYNLALNEQKAGNFAMSLALAERSSYLDPLNFGSIKLKGLAFDKLRNINNEQIEAIPVFYRIMDFIPYVFILALCLCLILVFAYNLGLTVHEEKIKFKSQPKKRFKSALAAAALFFSVLLLFYKTHSQEEAWACVIAKEARLFTGPNSSDYPQVSTLSPGNCSRLVLTKKTDQEDWVSLDPVGKAAGWTEKSQVFIVRGNKFDPLFKSD
jgi:hypothetical protein